MGDQYAAMIPKWHFWRMINKHLSFLTWRAILLIVLGHAALGYIGLKALGEHDLINNATSYVYFYTVTGSTVGFGDMSPVTEPGKMFVGLFMVPTSIALFGIILTKAGGALGGRIRKSLEGRMNFDGKLYNHTVILGYQGEKTDSCVAQLRDDDPGMEIVLCTEKEIQNPLPDQVHFVRGAMLGSEDVLRRGGVANAGKILVMARDDEQALAVSLAAYRMAKHDDIEERMVVYCNTEYTAELIRSACPTAEAFSSRSVDMMVRAAQDPGSTQIHEQMLSSSIGPTQYRVQLPTEFTGTFGDLYQLFKEKWNAIPLGISNSKNGGLIMNPPLSTTVTGEQYVFYISDSRITPQQIEREYA